MKLETNQKDKIIYFFNLFGKEKKKFATVHIFRIFDWIFLFISIFIKATLKLRIALWYYCMFNCVLKNKKFDPIIKKKWKHNWTMVIMFSLLRQKN